MKALRRLVPRFAADVDWTDWAFGFLTGWRFGVGGGFVVWLGPLEFGVEWD